MIFDCDLVTRLVAQWEDERDPVVLGDILVQSRALIEAIVSTFDSDFRDDLIQESSLRVQYALDSFDPDISNLYSYLSTVIRNVCITYVKKQGRDIPTEDIELLIEGDSAFAHDEDIFVDLVVRNRTRFPSLPVSVIDEITEMIYDTLSCEGHKPAGIIADIVVGWDVARPIATTIYHSTLVYLRWKYTDHLRRQDKVVTDEFSLTRDLEELLGHKAFAKIATVFSGMYIRMP